MRLVDLWTLKAEIAGDRPFDARKDIVDAAMDIINAAALSFDDSMSTTKNQLDFLNSAEGTETTVAPDGSIQFARAADIPAIAAINSLTDYIGGQLRALLPKLEHRIRYLTSPDLRHKFARKNEAIRNETSKSLARFASGDKTTLSALDNLLQREMNASAKAGRKPDFYSARISDEVYAAAAAGTR